jgi:hypothetical protein
MSQLEDMEKVRRVIDRVCTFPGCNRKAAKAWTTCDRHFTAGMRKSHWVKLHALGEHER